MSRQSRITTNRNELVVCLCLAQNQFSLGDALSIDIRFYFKLQKLADLAQLLRAQNDSLLRPDRVKKFHLPNGREQKARLRIFRMG